jgi:hypothetical protein
MKVRAAFRVVTLMNADEPISAHVRDQDARHTERHP